MAEKRMFSNKITQSDPFLSMPPSAQNLYFHLSMDADDDGFVNRPKAIMRMVNASDDDMNLLIVRKFIIPFDVQDDNSLLSMICVIKHWFIHNNIRNDRKKDTTYVRERNMLVLNDNGAYSMSNKPVDNSLQPSDNQVSTKSLPSVLESSVLECSVLESSVEEKIPYQRIISYLNKEANKKYRSVPGNNKHIKARWNEGYDLEDFKTVIDNMVSNWKDAKWLDNNGKEVKGSSFLRPSTLFSNKFDTYLNDYSVIESEDTKEVLEEKVYTPEEEKAIRERIARQREKYAS